MDREKVIKDLEEYRDREFVKEGITFFDADPRYRKLIINNALALLKEQEAEIEQLNRFVNGFSRDAMPVVRCKNCKHYRINTVYPGTNMITTYCAKTGIAESRPEWFCADGERKD